MDDVSKCTSIRKRKLVFEPENFTKLCFNVMDSGTLIRLYDFIVERK